METRTSTPPEPTGTPVRTRSVAREGAAIPLPSGPLGHLRVIAPDDAAQTGPAAAPAARPWGRWFIPIVAVACIALGVIIGVMVSLVQATDANQARVDAERAQEQVAADRAELDTLRATLDEQKKQLTQRENDVMAREDAVSRKEADLQVSQNELDERQADLDAAEQQVQSRSDAWDPSQWVPGGQATQGTGRNRG